MDASRILFAQIFTEFSFVKKTENFDNNFTFIKGDFL